MARLRQLRLVSIGHPNARFADVTLDFTRGGAPADSTLWLRNGGGKSSLLSLFFGLVRPDLREFLGARADAGQRRLDQYIGDDDRAVIAALWELDEGSTFLTGGFYERRGGTGELRKLWFSGLASGEEPHTTLAGLPLLTESGRRRNLASFREEWQTLRERRPELQLAVTEVQREWGERLRAAGIDPELFSYQLRMNTREGGADELFRFEDHESFVDFLLELAFSPEHATEVSNNVGRYREQLRLRKEEYLPERELVAALVSAMQPLVAIAGERAHLHLEAARARLEVHDLARHVSCRQEARLTQAAAAASELAHAAEAQALAERREREAQERAAQLGCFAATRRHEQAEQEMAEIDRRRREAEANRKRWAAARLLRDRRRHEDAAAELTRQLALRQATHEPLRHALAEAALAYAGALEAALGRAQEREHDASAAAAQERASARELRATAGARRQEAHAHERKAAVIEAAVAAERRERQRLVSEGILGPDEPAEAAEQRAHEAGALARTAAASFRGRAAELGDEAVVVRARVEALTRELGKLDAVVSARRLELERARADEKAVEASPALGRLLDDPAPSLERAGDLEPRLAQALAEVARRLVDQRNARMLAERALHHLRREGFLPPSAPVAELIGRLAARVPGVRSGWKEIATNGPAGAAARRGLVERHPHLATGVIVRDADWPRACELAREGPAPEAPVVIAPQSAFARPGVEAFVVGPASAAYFDREAAEVEERRLEHDLARLTEELEADAGEDAALVALRDAYRVFRSQHPLGWEAAQRAALADLEADAAGCARDLAHEQRRLAGLDAEREAALAGAEERTRAVHVAEQAERTLASFRRQHPGGQEGALAAARAAAAALLEEAGLLDAQAAVAEERADAAEITARELAGAAARLAQERGRVRHLDGPIVTAAGNLEALAARYEEHLAVYEQRVGSDGLLLARRHEEDAARTAQARLARTLEHQPFDEADVVAALAGLGVDEQVEDREERVAGEANALFSQIGNAAKEAKRWQEARAAAEARCRELGIAFVGATSVAGPAHALEEAELAEQEARAARLDAEEQLAHVARARETERVAHQDAQTLRTLGQRLATLAERFDEHFPAAPLSSPASAWPDDGALEGCFDRLEASLGELRTRARALDSRRGAAARAVQRIAAAEANERLASPIPRRFRAFDELALESDARALAAELDRRATVLDSELADLGRHRDVLVKAALDVASAALKLLRDAEKQSRLPAHLPWGAGETFLRISTSAPDAPAEREARMAELIDQLALEGNIPTGVGFVQRALRRLARPMRVKVVFPDPGSALRVVDIPETARFSGGEQLTCAILLYCTLAQLRSRRRASARRPSSVLLLDNPIGRASRVSFLELQREVARAMGIQLVYTTGVQDLEAVGALPNVIRLRNERVDRNTGHQVVELDHEVVAARLARAEWNR